MDITPVSYEVSYDGGTTWAEITSKENSGTFTGTVSGLTNGTSYTFLLLAANYAGAGTPSAESDSVTPTLMEATPNAVIDYVNETLTGLVTDENYNIGGTAYPADASGNSGNPGGGTTTTPSTPAIPGGNTVSTPPGQPPVSNPDGSVTLPGGGTITTPGGSEITVPPGTTIDKDGKIPADLVADREFADWDSISGYAKNAVNVLVAQGIINGKPSNLFDPKGQATRAELAAALHRFKYF